LSACERCGGTGFLVEEQDGREFARPCGCRRRGREQGEGLLRTTCRIPPRYEHCSLASFEPDTPRQIEALGSAMSYVQKYPHGGADKGLGLLFTGGNGVGKTHLAVGVLRELVLERGASGQFWDFHELIREIKSSYDPETRTTEVQVLAPVVEADVLLLDDLGAWKMTDWMNDTLFYILNSRYLAQRATLITTNYPDADRERVLQADALQRREYLAERIGQRLRSRLLEMCAVVRVEGTDWRRHRQHSNQQVVDLGSEPGGR